MPPTKRKADAKKPAAKTLYARPEKLKKGDKLTEEYVVGERIGSGGFGDIYTVCKAQEKEYKYVVKCEPAENGPLFCEINFYSRNCKAEDVKAFKTKRGLKSVGVPVLIKSGVKDFNDKKHRFLIMPRYGESIEQLLKNNGGCLPEQTVYRLAIQMLDCYEYIHSRGYIHGDLKGANILLGYGKADASQAFLLDFGLAHRYTTEETLKRDPKQAHNGTKEYMSRDSHNGVISMRSDMEILAYNLLEWLGGRLPWEKLVKDNVAKVDEKVQKAKEEFMSNLNANLKSLNVPKAVKDYFVYISSLKHNEKPSYEKCRRFFEDGLKSIKAPITGDLNVIKMKSPSKNRAKKLSSAIDSDVEEICASDDDDGDVIQQDSKRRVPSAKKFITTTNKKKVSPASKVTKKASRRSLSCSPPKKAKYIAKSNNTPSPRRRIETSAIDVEDIDVENSEKPSTSRAAAARLHNKHLKQENVATGKASLKMSPVVSLRNLSLKKSSDGSTIVNNNITPNPKSKKVYEVNLELNVSMNADVVVNVKRKKPHSTSTPTTSKDVSSSPFTQNGSATTSRSRSPRSRARTRNEYDSSDTSGTPVVTVKKYKR